VKRWVTVRERVVQQHVAAINETGNDDYVIITTFSLNIRHINYNLRHCRSLFHARLAQLSRCFSVSQWMTSTSSAALEVDGLIIVLLRTA